MYHHQILHTTIQCPIQQDGDIRQLEHLNHLLIIPLLARDQETLNIFTTKVFKNLTN